MRALRILLIVVVILGGLFVAADRIAVHFAESEAADKAQQTQGLSEKPDVSIKGFPFLTQVMGQKLDDVEVTADGITAGTGDTALRIERFTADLHGVRLSNGFASAVADTADGSALISYADLSKAAPNGVSVTYGGESATGAGKVKLTASLLVPGAGTVKRSVVSQISVTNGGTISLKAVSIPDLSELPAGTESLIREQIDFSRELTGLPEGIELQSVTTSADGITVAATGKNVVLAS
jgi:hypothetical protein